MSQFYDGTKLLTLKDIDGMKPELYMCVGNRTAGKTYYFKRLLLRKFIKYNEKFCILVRFSYELDGIAENFFKDLQQIDFKGSIMSGKKVAKGLFVELFIDGKHCGYAISINSADTIKKYSSRFVDVDNMFFDEFMSETNKYCPNELEKFQSIHISVARGDGKSVRYVPVFLASNTVSQINPYFVSFEIHKRLTPQTKFLRGYGWVLEQCYVESAAKAISDSGFGKAFSQSNYIDFATNNSYLNDNTAFIEKIEGAGRIIGNLTADGVTIGVWEYEQLGLLYLAHKHDPSYPLNITYQTKDHKPNMIMMRRSTALSKYLRTMYEQGLVRFEDLICKNMGIDFIGYSVL